MTNPVRLAKSSSNAQVGSSLELDQRLSDPPRTYSAGRSHLGTDDPPPLHVFDIRQSTRAAQAWQKYVIDYCQSGTPSPVRDSAPEPEKSKPDDYHSLLVRLQVLELEVKLLKEALKTHAITDPLGPQLPQQSVFASAYRNSDLSKQSPIPALQATPVVPNSSPQYQNTKQCLGWVGGHGYHYPNNNASKRESFDVVAVCPVEPSDQPSPRTSQKDEFIDSLRFAPAASPLPGHTAPGAMSELSMQGSLPHSSQPAQHAVSREPKNNAESSPETVPGGPTNLKTSKAQTKHPLHDVITAGPHLNGKSSIAQQEQNVKTERVAVSIPRVAISHNASKSLLDLEPEAEIARFPTIFQLEKEDVRSVQAKNSNVTDVSQPTIPITRANTVTSSLCSP